MVDSITRFAYGQQRLGQLFLVDAAIVGHVLATLVMHANAAMFVHTHEALFVDAINERAAVVAKSRLLEKVLLERVRYVHAKAAAACCERRRAGLLRVFVARTARDNELVASFVQHERAHLTLVALFSDAPNEVFAMRTKRGLFQIRRHKPVLVDNVHSSPNGAATFVEKSMSFCELASFRWRLLLFLLVCILLLLLRWTRATCVRLLPMVSGR